MNDRRADSQRLDEVIAEYLHAEEAGAAPPSREFLAAHPDLADELREFFADRDQVHGLAGLPGEPPQRRFVPPTVRYIGDYELLDEIARGGMGVVYRARQTSLNRTVAIKMILSGHLASEEDVKRFQTEAEAAGNLRHPGIVGVHEVGLHEGHHYFSMDFIEGRSLAEIVRDNPLPARKAAEFVQAIAAAVEYAHQQGTLHRDLKPSNVLIDAHDAVHITDFGLAARVEGDSDLTRTGQVLGTPAYMSPEQAQGKRGLIGPASDIYSLGVILYELLTGRPPFRAESSVQTLQQVIDSEPVALRLLNPKVPGDLETICLKCLQKQPHKRYPTAAELAADLGRWLSGTPIAARPVGHVERSWQWCRRNPSTTGLLASILLLVIGTFSAALWFVNDRGQRRAEAIQRASERAERLSRLEQGIADAIDSADALRKRSLTLTDRPEEWGAVLSSARSAQKRAESLIEQDPERIDAVLRRHVEALGEKLHDDELDQQFAARYDSIRLEASDVNLDSSMFSGEKNFSGTSEALAALGLIIGQTPVSEAAESIRNRPIPIQELRISALDLCLNHLTDAEPGAEEWILAVLAAVDSDPWRSSVREALVGNARDELRRLAGKADVVRQPTSLLIHLARALSLAGFKEDAVSLLQRLNFVRPGDFWVNHSLGFLCSSSQLDRIEESVRFFQAAVAVRPESPGAWLNLGLALSDAEDRHGALAAFQRAVEIEPEYASAYNSLGAVYARLGEYTQAATAFHTAARLQPTHTLAHANLGIVLRRYGDLPGAIFAFQQAVDLEPENERWRKALVRACLDAGELEQAITSLQLGIEVGAPSYQDYLDLACLLRYTGNVDGYRDVCRTMFEKFAASDRVADRHGMLTACLSFPESEVTPELLEAVRVHGDSPIRIRRRLLGLAYYRLQRDPEALEILETTAEGERSANSRLGSQLCLALVQLRLGHLDPARKTIQDARATSEESTWHEEPWGVQASLWREVQAAMEEAGVDEEIPDLPVAYADKSRESVETGAADRLDHE